MFHGHDKDKFFCISEILFHPDSFTNANVSNSCLITWSLLQHDGIWIPLMDEVNRIGRDTESRRLFIGFLSPLIITGQTWPRAQSRQITVESETLYQEPSLDK